MAGAPFKLPPIPLDMSLPAAFKRWWNDLGRALSKAITDIQTVNANQNAQLITLEATVRLLQDVQTGVATAQQASAQAQASADAGGNPSAVSANATDPSVVLTGADWVAGPLVSLLGVVAGDLTLTGTRPLGPANSLSNGATMDGEFRVVEIAGGVETVIVSEEFGVEDTAGGEQGVPSSLLVFAAALDATLYPRTTTGAVDYRMDLRRLSGGEADVKAYLNARRS